MTVQLDEAISAINRADDPIAAYDDVALAYDEDDKDLILPWLAEMAATLQAVADDQ
jgi:hypothetical protein